MMQPSVVEQDCPPILPNQDQLPAMAYKDQPPAMEDQDTRPDWLPSTRVYYTVTRNNPETDFWSRWQGMKQVLIHFQ